MIKVLVVDDSFVMRALIKDILSADSDIKVVGEAIDGEDALVKTKELKPDVILLDIEMPKMDGLEFLKQQFKISSEKVIILSSLVQVGSTQTNQARMLGAMDVIPKPSGAISLDLKQKKGHDIVQSIYRVSGSGSSPSGLGAGRMSKSDLSNLSNL